MSLSLVGHMIGVLTVWAGLLLLRKNKNVVLPVWIQTDLLHLRQCHTWGYDWTNDTQTGCCRYSGTVEAVVGSFFDCSHCSDTGWFSLSLQTKPVDLSVGAVQGGPIKSHPRVSISTNMTPDWAQLSVKATANNSRHDPTITRVTLDLHCSTPLSAMFIIFLSSTASNLSQGHTGSWSNPSSHWATVVLWPGQFSSPFTLTFTPFKVTSRDTLIERPVIHVGWSVATARRWEPHHCSPVLLQFCDAVTAVRN